MPVICWKTKKTQTTISARLTPAVHGFFRRRCCSPPCTSAAAARTSSSVTSIPSKANALLVSSKRPCNISHRGDSGI
jgi:hypothetical protein